MCGGSFRRDDCGHPAFLLTIDLVFRKRFTRMTGSVSSLNLLHDGPFLLFKKSIAAGQFVFSGS